MGELEESDLRSELEAAEAAMAELGQRERRLWERIKLTPQRWREPLYPHIDTVWVVAVMGRRCLYFNPVECGWGWGRFESWGEIRDCHCQDGEIQHAVYQVLFAIDHGGQG